METTKRKRRQETDAVKMIDVSDKPVVERLAEAEGRIHLQQETVEKIRQGLVEKGDIFSVADVAGILAAKKTPELIPLCHSIPLSNVNIGFHMDATSITARCTVRGESKTGVEMEALAGVSLALLTVWDMIKYLEKDKDGQYPHTRITDIRVLRKRKETPTR